MQRKFQTAFHILGQLGANANIRWQSPSDCTLVHVSAVQSDADGCGIEIGSSSDADGYIQKFTCGVSNTPVQKEALTDFNGALADSQYPDIDDGDIICIAVDYDYNAGQGSGAASDITIVLTFVEG
jgi:hypothetical protein